MNNEIQKTLDYIEENLFDENISVACIARYMALSESRLQHYFKMTLGVSIMEYIRKRRLSFAAALVMQGCSAQEISEKLGYSNVESFERAFKVFHGATLSSIRNRQSPAKFFHKIVTQLVKRGGNITEFKIENRQKIVLCGFSRRMEGDPAHRYEQVHCFFEETRKEQELLENYSVDKNNDFKKIYCVVKNVDINSFTYYIGYDCGGKAIDGFEQLEVDWQRYLIFETEKCKYPIPKLIELREQIEEWLPASNFLIARCPEVEIINWFSPSSLGRCSRYVELWLPLENEVVPRALDS